MVAQLTVNQLVAGSNPAISANAAAWCNGSTKDFGSFSRGSNPLAATNI